MGEAERFAIRAWVVCGTIVGGLAGVFAAPRWQRRLLTPGEDPSVLSALVIITAAALLGGLLTWRSVRKSP
jgi:hypothetical protein